ncbi:UNKNOWN [Stylonychia lemnae]|uniref:Uncharacterized protein n=1 Tax=Stylonychia lemnae TaxID=5949 RepID=A0A078A0B0_STYLE|nr:UNKNOWN [Stylonychia lemnae]|eukprot:CDW75580.1 UNKNOWN [Stylonychia lemnae]
MIHQLNPDQKDQQNKFDYLKHEDPKNLQNQDILVTVKQHQQIVMTPEDLQKMQHSTEDENQRQFQSFSGQQEQIHTPVYEHFYNVITQAHEKAMPSYLKEQVQRNSEYKLIKAEDFGEPKYANDKKDLNPEDQYIQEHFPITEQQLFNAFHEQPGNMFDVTPSNQEELTPKEILHYDVIKVPKLKERFKNFIDDIKENISPSKIKEENLTEEKVMEQIEKEIEKIDQERRIDKNEPRKIDFTDISI